MSSVRTFFTQFSHFVSGGIASLLFGLLTFPILTRALGRDQYGALSLVTTTMIIAVAISKAGLSNSMLRFYEEYRDSAVQEKVFSSTVFIRGLFFSFAATFLYLVGLFILHYRHSLGREMLLSLIVMSLYLFVRPLNIIVINFQRLAGRTILLNLATVGGKIISVSLSLFIFWYLIRNVHGYFLGVALGETVLTVLLLNWFFRNFKVSPAVVSGELAVKMIKFGLPLLLVEISYLLLSYSSRYLIIYFLGNDALGVYSVGYNIPMYITDIITFSLSYSVVPIYVSLYKKEGRAKTEQFLETSLHYLLIVSFPVLFGYYAVCDDLIIFLASAKYAEAASFSPMIMVATFLLGMNSVFNAGLFMQKKSGVILWIMLGAVAMNLAISALTLPILHVTGTAIASLVASIFATVLTLLFSNRYIAIRLRSEVLYYLVLSAVMVFVVKQVHAAPLWLGLALKIIVGFLLVFVGTLAKERAILNKLQGIIKGGL